MIGWECGKEPFKFLALLVKPWMCLCRAYIDEEMMEGTTGTWSMARRLSGWKNIYTRACQSCCRSLPGRWGQWHSAGWFVLNDRFISTFEVMDNVIQKPIHPTQSWTWLWGYLARQTNLPYLWWYYCREWYHPAVSTFRNSVFQKASLRRVE